MADIVRQKLMSVNEVFLYRIPPLRTSGGHRAEDWNLASPLQTCSLSIERRGNQLHLLFYHPPESESVFALSKIDVEEASMERFVEPVVDSSRYFVVRVVNEQSGRDALVGFGFRDRDEATDFAEVLQHYARSVQREQKAVALHNQEHVDLSLKEGEQIHIELKGKSTIGKKANKTSKGNAGGGGFPLLKKPPPPSHEDDNQVDISFDIQLDEKAVSGGGGADGSESDGAVNGSQEDEDWRDFESSS